MTASQVEITEQDLDNLRAESADVLGLHHSDSRVLLCASVVLARAGLATPGGVYELVNGEWILIVSAQF